MHYRRICFFILLFGFIGASTVYSWDKEFFENIEQPIAFPHKLHVVNNGISCEYCHSSARNSVLSDLEIVDVSAVKSTKIQFGATVKIRKY